MLQNIQMNETDLKANKFQLVKLTKRTSCYLISLMNS